MRSNAGFMVSVLIWSVIAASAAAGPTANVTVSSSQGLLGIGQTQTFSVFASVANPASNLDGIFSYDLNVNFSPAGVIGIVPGSVVQPNSDTIVNPGTISQTGLSACYGFYFNTQNFGISSPKELLQFSLQGLSVGSASVSISPDATIGADFLLQKSSSVPVDYSAATTLMTVAHMPDPNTIQIWSGETLGLGDSNALTSSQTVENAGLFDVTAGDHTVDQVIGVDANILQGVTKVDGGATLRVGTLVQNQVIVSGTLILGGVDPPSDGSLQSPPALVPAGSTPEPGPLMLLVFGGLAVLKRRPVNPRYREPKVMQPRIAGALAGVLVLPTTRLLRAPVRGRDRVGKRFPPPGGVP